jgi:RNA polymerase sigma factor (sigma-70 family)
LNYFKISRSITTLNLRSLIQTMIKGDLIEILKKCRKYDSNAQRQLYEGFYRFGLSICVRYVANLEVAQELLNDSYLKVFTSIEKYDKDMVFVTWFKKIIVNTCIDHLRKSHRDLQLGNLEEAIDLGVEMDVFGKFSIEEIAELIQQLPPAYRTVFNLYVVEGYEHKEIASMLGIEIKTSTSNLTRARKKLQELILSN